MEFYNKNEVTHSIGLIGTFLELSANREFIQASLASLSASLPLMTYDIINVVAVPILSDIVRTQCASSQGGYRSLDIMGFCYNIDRSLAIR